ncbi:MAG: response regulator transcription factor [Opitutaceae bacterium]|nr:response regulator transcription factor [Opitutaceae bacterium]
MKILVVEDDPRLLRNLAEALREQGYAVDTAAEGIEGLYKAESTEYDAVILDVMLPGLDGWSILQRLRRKRRTPVLMLTARDATSDRVKGLDIGADDYLVKPFALSELYARLRAVIRRSAGQAEATLVIGDITIDLRSRTLAQNSQPVSLTPREYAILEYLAVHRGKVISRIELFEHIFDEHADAASNLVDVHVSNLRKKLGPNLIVTRRGQGFCIEA